MSATDWAARRLHFIGIGGAGMSGLALVARALGAAVTGSDRAESSYSQRLRAAGIDPVIGHDAANVPDAADVIVSTAIPDTNPELGRARERGLQVLHRGDLLAEVAGLKRSIAVAGAHGKTTTSGMLAHLLRAGGRARTRHERISAEVDIEHRALGAFEQYTFPFPNKHIQQVGGIASHRA